MTASWLGELPQRWSVGALKWFGSVTIGKMLQSTSIRADDVEQPYLRAANIQPDGRLALDDIKTMWFTQAEARVLSLDGGDVVVVEGGVGGYGRAAFIAKSMGGVGYQNSVNRVRPHIGNDGRFLTYVLLAARGAGYLEAYSNVVSMPHLTAEKLEAMDVPLPPVDEQRQIADFLDAETARIDRLVAKQTALIDTLSERRAAVATRLVRFGLRADQPIVQSADPLVGWHPADWVVTSLRHCVELLDHRRIPLSSEERGERLGAFPYYGASGVIDHVDDFLFDEPLVLVSEDGANLLARSSPIAFSAVGKYWVNNHAHVVRPFYGPAAYWTGYIESVDVSPLVTGAAQPKLTAAALMSMRVAVPPTVGEMTSISAALDVQTAKIDALMAKAERFIEAAKERRAALITAAVRGQIDVRELAA